MTAKSINKTPHPGGFSRWAKCIFGGLIFALAVVLFFGLLYPHHLHYQEQFQMFLFDGNYVCDIVRMPGGVADLLGRFCTQFFLYAWAGATIVGLLLMAVQLLTARLVRWGRLYGLSFVPAGLLWLFLLDENALLGGVWALLLTLLSSWGFDKLPVGWLRRVALLVAAPVLYWAVGPMSVLFFVLQACRPDRAVWRFAPFVLLLLVPVLLANSLPVPPAKLWTGLHYHRYPTVVAALLWASAASVFLLVLLARGVRRWANAPGGRVLSSLTFCVVAVGMGVLVWQHSNFKAEKTMRYDFMACHQQWNRILETIHKEKPNNQIGVTVQNLALGMRGQLVNHLFDYNQNGMLGLLPDVQRDATSSLTTAEAFYQLGMISEAQRTTFESQEAILDFQKSSRCYKRLAQTNLILGSYAVARKYLLTLRKTLFYRHWADETLALLGHEEAIDQHPEYGRLRRAVNPQDSYFGDRLSPLALETLYTSHPDNELAYQYMMASFMLTGDRERFMHYASQNR